MAVRYHQTADRLIISKPGFNANQPGLPDEAKLMDTNWGFAGLLIASGVWGDDAPLALGEAGATEVTTPITITFPDCGYIPSVYLFSHMNSSQYGFQDVGFSGVRQTYMVGRGRNDLDTQYSEIFRGRIVVTRSRWPNTRYRARFPNGIRYMVFGVSQ